MLARPYPIIRDLLHFPWTGSDGFLVSWQGQRILILKSLLLIACPYTNPNIHNKTYVQVMEELQKNYVTDCRPREEFDAMIERSTGPSVEHFGTTTSVATAAKCATFFNKRGTPTDRWTSRMLATKMMIRRLFKARLPPEPDRVSFVAYFSVSCDNRSLETEITPYLNLETFRKFNGASWRN